MFTYYYVYLIYISTEVKYSITQENDIVYEEATTRTVN